MGSITFDGRSLMVDGRRVWLVSGTICYARVPPEHWADRIHAARLAGLNAIETPVIWSVHEPLPGQLDFSGPRDLRRFVELIGQAGLYCILRPGPYVGADWDFGGLPPWLHEIPGIALRTANGPFLEACSRYLTAVAQTVRSLQVTSPGRAGPLILVQNEYAWTCGDDELAARYLGELNRYLREAGLTVPTINAHNLWQGVEGEIDCWRGSTALAATVRQLRHVRPAQPPIVIELSVGPASTWGSPEPDRPEPLLLQRRLAEVLAAGGQFNIDPFHGGTNFGFSAGRRGDHPAAFVTTSYDRGAPLAEHGGPGPSFHLVRRLCTFASRFGRVLAHLDPDYQPVVIDPASVEAPRDDAGWSAVHTRGTQGGVVFVFAPLPSQARHRQTSLLLPDGSSLTVDVGAQAVAWLLLGVHLGGRTRLDYCTLNALALVGRTLVCFGPAGSTGVVSINGTPLEVAVPRGRDPLVIELEGIQLVVLSEELADATWVLDEQVIIGARAVRQDGSVDPMPGWNAVARIDATGKVTRIAIDATSATRGRAVTTPRITEWAIADTREYLDGTSARYAQIEGPAPMSRLGSASGYGWYRLQFRSTGARRVRLAAPQAADRLLVALDGQIVGVLGTGPGAEPHLLLSLRKGAHTLVMLADNMGRACEGIELGEPKGLFGPVWETRILRVARPTIETGTPINLLAFQSPLWDVHAGETTLPQRITWTIMHRRHTPLFLHLAGLEVRGLVLHNDEPVRFVDRGGPSWIVMEADRLSRGRNRFQFAPLREAGDGADRLDALGAHLSAQVSFLEGSVELSRSADWAFARWEPPAATAYQPTARASAAGFRGPSWWRGSFVHADIDTPLAIDLTGMRKGQIYIDGRHLGRYFVSTATGRQVGPQTRYLVPAPWLSSGSATELVLFDEHGGNPWRTRLVCESGVWPLRA